MTPWIMKLMAGAAKSYLVESISYVLAAGALVGLLWFGARWTERRRIQDRAPGRNDRRREVISSLRTIATFAITILITIALVRRGLMHVSLAIPPLWLAALEFVAMVIAHDTYFYWMHRGLHHRIMFRRAHALHHLSRTPTPWAAYSFAPVEAIFEAAFVPLFLLFVPFHAIVVIAFMLHEIVRNVIIHSGHEFAWNGFTRSRWTGWLTTTTHHDLHHSEGRYNFALYFTWWDRMMGTEHPHYHERFDAVVGRNGRPAAQPESA